MTKKPTPVTTINIGSPGYGTGVSVSASASGGPPLYKGVPLDQLSTSDKTELLRHMQNDPAFADMILSNPWSNSLFDSTAANSISTAVNSISSIMTTPTLNSAIRNAAYKEGDRIALSPFAGDRYRTIASLLSRFASEHDKYGQVFDKIENNAVVGIIAFELQKNKLFVNQEAYSYTPTAASAFGPSLVPAASVTANPITAGYALALPSLLANSFPGFDLQVSISVLCNHVQTKPSKAPAPALDAKPRTTCEASIEVFPDTAATTFEPKVYSASHQASGYASAALGPVIATLLAMGSIADNPPHPGPCLTAPTLVF